MVAPLTATDPERSVRLRPQRVVAALSGGVDSAVAAALACRQGQEVLGFTLRLYDAPRSEGRHGSCCAPEDIDDARRVARALGIPFYLLSASDRFEKHVIRPFLDAYLKGETPVPCEACNRHLKFGHLLRRARALSARLCTGHYARIERGPDGRYRLLRALDVARDQSYFLYGLSQQDLAEIDFPLGQRLKSDVRALAADLGLPVAEKPDSQQLCFVAGNYVDYLEKRVPAPDPGSLVAADGQRVGAHGGVHRFTVGQRRGLPVLGGQPQYVRRIDAESATVEIGPAASLERTEIELRDTRYPGGLPRHAFEALVRIRHQHAGEVATVTPLTENRAKVRFRKAVRAPAPGQAAVFYSGEETLGGGTITATASATQEISCT
jgi:tRNA-uridine 2-sulfurtransferase